MTDIAAAVPSDDEMNWRLVTGPPARMARCDFTFPHSSDGVPGNRDEPDRRPSYRLTAWSENGIPANRSDHMDFLGMFPPPGHCRLGVRQSVAKSWQLLVNFVLTGRSDRA
jgi:hypothetical protein